MCGFRDVIGFLFLSCICCLYLYRAKIVLFVWLCVSKRSVWEWKSVCLCIHLAKWWGEMRVWSRIDLFVCVCVCIFMNWPCAWRRIGSRVLLFLLLVNPINCVVVFGDNLTSVSESKLCTPYRVDKCLILRNCEYFPGSKYPRDLVRLYPWSKVLFSSRLSS